MSERNVVIGLPSTRPIHFEIRFAIAEAFGRVARMLDERSKELQEGDPDFVDAALAVAHVSNVCADFAVKELQSLQKSLTGETRP